MSGTGSCAGREGTDFGGRKQKNSKTCRTKHRLLQDMHAVGSPRPSSLSAGAEPQRFSMLPLGEVCWRLGICEGEIPRGEDSPGGET